MKNIIFVLKTNLLFNSFSLDSLCSWFWIIESFGIWMLLLCSKFSLLCSWFSFHLFFTCFFTLVLVFSMFFLLNVLPSQCSSLSMFFPLNVLPSQCSEFYFLYSLCLLIRNFCTLFWASFCCASLWVCLESVQFTFTIQI